MSIFNEEDALEVDMTSSFRAFEDTDTMLSLPLDVEKFVSWIMIVDPTPELSRPMNQSVQEKGLLQQWLLSPPSLCGLAAKLSEISSLLGSNTRAWSCRIASAAQKPRASQKLKAHNSPRRVPTTFPLLRLATRAVVSIDPVRATELSARQQTHVRPDKHLTG